MDARTFPVLILVYGMSWAGAGCGDSGGTGTGSDSDGSTGASSGEHAPPTSTATADATLTAPPTSTSGADGGGGDGDGSGGGEPGSTGLDADCGDGVIQDDEECDDGFDNGDDKKCTAHCKRAFCGDGLLLSVDCVDTCPDCADPACKECGNDCEACKKLCYGCENRCETCDPGDDPEKCQDTCQPPGELCGNGQLDEDEDCDIGELIDDGSDPTRQPCNFCRFGEVRRVFVSSALVASKIAGDDEDALDVADAKCQQLAAAADLPRATHFRAWLSRSAKSPDDKNCPNRRFIHQLDVDWPFILPDGTIVAHSYGELIKAGPLAAIDLDENQWLVEGTMIWTGTTPKGLASPWNCLDWTLTDAQKSATVGAISAGQPFWTIFKDKTPCDNLAPIYCFEDEVEQAAP